MSLEPPTPVAVDGALIVDKPAGPTSHDVVARVRRVARSQRVGHTGTLDPFATGVLPLLLGRATRLAQFYAQANKAYRAELRLGVATDTHDATGRVIATEPSSLPSRAQLEPMLAGFRGTFHQVPPAFSAKKVQGVPAYRKARRAEPVALAPVRVEVQRLELASLVHDSVVLVLECSSGFYVRALAHDLGRALGCGAHLVALRRTRSGEFDERQAVPLDVLENDPRALWSHLVPLEALLPALPVAWVSGVAADRVGHGTAVTLDVVERWEGISPASVIPGVQPRAPHETPPRVKVRHGADGHLVAIAEIVARGDAAPVLQPSVVLV